MRVLIVGGGIGGLALAVALERRGIAADLIERRPAYGPEGAGVVLGANVMAALRPLGLTEAVTAAGAEVTQAEITDVNGHQLQRTDFGFPDLPPAVAIHRSALQQVLLGALAQRPLLGTTLQSYQITPEGAEATRSDGVQNRYDLIVGADGLRSALRADIAGPIEPRYSGYTCWRFVVPLPFKQGVTEMWGPGKRVGVVPIGGGKVYVFLTANAPQRAPAPFEDDIGLHQEFAMFGDPGKAAIEALRGLEGVLHNDIEDCLCPRWWAPRRVLIGDAAHAVTPNMGQGAGLAIEDAVALAALLAAEGPGDATLARFEALRKPRAAFIHQRSWDFGRVAQWRSAPMIWLRNRLFALTPPSVGQKALEAVVRDMPGVPLV